MQIQNALREVKGIDFELQFRLVPIEILTRLKHDMEKHRFSGAAGQFIEEHYMHYNFDVPQNYRSILVVSYPQPHAQIGIETEGKVETETETEGGSGLKYVTMPSGYYNPSYAEHMHQEILHALEIKGIRAKAVHLPLKLLGARSGLTQYGKNNISYVRPYGSHHRLVAFFTDMQAEAESNLWVESIQMEDCKYCNACVEACPYSAIQDHEDLIDPNKCLSFYMDLMDPLPPWITQAEAKGKTHINISAIIGCTHCQDCCHLNHYFSAESRETLAVISKAQVDEIKAVDHYENLSDSTKALVHTLGFEEGYGLLKRNMGVL